jgi:hypothetical protein
MLNNTGMISKQCALVMARLTIALWGVNVVTGLSPLSFYGLFGDVAFLLVTFIITVAATVLNAVRDETKMIASIFARSLPLILVFLFLGTQSALCYQKNINIIDVTEVDSCCQTRIYLAKAQTPYERDTIWLAKSLILCPILEWHISAGAGSIEIQHINRRSTR